MAPRFVNAIVPPVAKLVLTFGDMRDTSARNTPFHPIAVAPKIIIKEITIVMSVPGCKIVMPKQHAAIAEVKNESVRIAPKYASARTPQMIRAMTPENWQAERIKPAKTKSNLSSVVK